MDLLPCPFCNCLHAPGILTVNIGHSGGYHHVVCNTNYAGCGAQGAVASTKELAAAAWNRRAANAPADPALLALARFGALMCRDAEWPTGFGDGADNVWHQPCYIDRDRTWVRLAMLSAGMIADDGYRPAPGIADAIAALLTPDGAASEVTDA